MWHRWVVAIAAVCLGLLGSARGQDLAVPREGPLVATLDADRLDRMLLPDGSVVRLDLEPFAVCGPEARIVIADGAGEHAADFDLAAISFWRGVVEGYPGSHVFLSIAEGSTIGRVELGVGRPTYAISSRGGDPEAGGVALGPGEVAIYRAAGGFWPEAPGTSCGVHDPKVVSASGALDGPDAPGSGLSTPARGARSDLRMARLALDVDYRFFRLFASERDAITYVVQLQGIVSDVFVRDVGTRLDITYLRLWSTPGDPYESGPAFPRDLPSGLVFDYAQTISGHRDARYGGMGNLCGPYSWVAYMIGRFGDPTRPNVFNWDIMVTAHELGHNLDGVHTHSLDRCTDPATSRRGTIMSYCHVHNSGGPAALDFYFQAFNRVRMRACTAPRLPADCNQNHVDDAVDIASGRSLDADGNGIPDECEDCNDNGVLDGIDIASGTSEDLNDNGLPDECEPDCNGNGVPDDIDITDGMSQDANGDAVPDECQADCDGDGVFDWVQIIADMSLDLDRDAVLDGCQDCDADGVIDLIAMDHANEKWIVSARDGLLKNYTQQAGVLRDVVGAGYLDQPTDLRITPDRRMLVTSAGDGRIVEFDHRGAYVRDLVDASAGLQFPIAMSFAADGTLLVVDRDAQVVRRFDLSSGAALPDAIADHLTQPVGLAVGPEDRLYVAEREGGVLEFDGATGAFLGEFVEPGAGGLVDPRGLLFFSGLDGQTRFVVADFGGDRLIEYHALTGQPIGRFDLGSYGGKLQRPWALRFGPDGHVHASNSRIDRPWPDGESRRHMFAYYVHQGAMVFATVRGHDSTLENPMGFDFVPGDGLDCNLNRIPDACDVADGTSHDRNRNGVPDECEDLCVADCDGDGSLTVFDFLCFGVAFDAGERIADCTSDGVIDVFDFLCFQNAFADGCP